MKRDSLDEIPQEERQITRYQHSKAGEKMMVGEKRRKKKERGDHISG